MNRRTIARGLLAATGLVAALSVAACTGSATASGSATTGTATTGTGTGAGGGQVATTVAPAPTTVDTGGVPTNAPPVQPAATRTSLTRECNASDLRLSFGGSDAGMSQQEQVLRFTNSGSRPCVIVGFPGVSYVTGAAGLQFGQAAQRAGAMRPQITLAPGQVASTVIHSVDPAVFDPNACQPGPVNGYRIYAPDDRAAMFIRLPAGTEGCGGNPPEMQLSVSSIKPGLGDPDQP